MLRPSSYIPPEQYPANSSPENVPAFVAEPPRKPMHIRRTVLVWHKDGPLHENAQRTIARYAKRGWRVEVVFDKAALRVPLSRPLPRAA